MEIKLGTVRTWEIKELKSEKICLTLNSSDSNLNGYSNNAFCTVISVNKHYLLGCQQVNTKAVDINRIN